jgi:hypothetical protein
MKYKILLIAIILNSCFNIDEADYQDGVHYNYSEGVLSNLFITLRGKTKNYYCFYTNGMIRYMSDSNNKYLIYDTVGNLVTMMNSKLINNENSYYYSTLDSTCFLVCHNNTFTLEINKNIIKWIDTSKYPILPNNYSLIRKKDSLEIYGYTHLQKNKKIASYSLENKSD